VGSCYNKPIMNAKWITPLDVFEADLQCIFNSLNFCHRNFYGANEEEIRCQWILIFPCTSVLCFRIEGSSFHVNFMSYQIITLLLHSLQLIEVFRSHLHPNTKFLGRSSWINELITLFFCLSVCLSVCPHISILPPFSQYVVHHCSTKASAYFPQSMSWYNPLKWMQLWRPSHGGIEIPTVLDITVVHGLWKC